MYERAKYTAKFTFQGKVVSAKNQFSGAQARLANDRIERNGLHHDVHQRLHFTIVSIS